MGGAPSHVLGDSLLQGGADVVRCAEWLERQGITHVVSVCEETPHDESALKGRLHIDVGDVTTADLYRHFEEATKFIHQARGAGGRVYVHCSAGSAADMLTEQLLQGLSRSSTITLAYLMSWLEMDLKTALWTLSCARNGVRPNAGFSEQLYRFERSELLQQLREALRAERNADEGLQRLYGMDVECLRKRREDYEQVMRNSYRPNQRPSDG